MTRPLPAALTAGQPVTRVDGRLKVTGQALMQQGGHSYDAITALDGKGESATYYFLVDRVLAAEAKLMTPGAVSEGGPPGRSP